MKSRTGKECKKVNCIRYKVYTEWFRNLGNRELGYCMSCKYAHASQYVKETK